MTPIRWKKEGHQLPLLIALKLAQHAAQRNPDNPARHARVAELHLMLLDAESAEQSWRKCLEHGQRTPRFLNGLANSLILLEQFDEAHAVAQEALNRGGDSARATRLISRSSRALQKHDDAIANARKSLELAPVHPSSRACLIHALKDAGQPLSAEAECTEAIERGILSTEILALHALLLGELGEDARCRELLDFPRFVHENELRTSPEETALLNRDVIQMLAERPETPVDSNSYTNHSSVSGGEVFLLSHEKEWPGMRRLRTQIKREVESYIRLQDGEHPWFRLKPEELSLNFWVLTMNQGGTAHSHIHEAGWLSGVYYVDVPQPDSNVAPPPGSLVLGPPPITEAQSYVMPSHTIMPRPGMLVLFPAYIYHQTVPTTSLAPRTCIAFDVL